MAIDFSTSALSVAGMPIAFAGVLLSRRIWLHLSTLLDIQYVLVGAFGFSLTFGYTLLSGFGVSTSDGLTRLLGEPAGPVELPIYAKALIILGLHLDFEFSYWFDHFLSHKIPFLWEFHKVHHSATVLTPFANWRVHPVDTDSIARSRFAAW